MRIRYSNTVEDLIAFTRYHYAHSPSARRARLKLQCAVVVAAFAGAAIREAAGRESAGWEIGAVVAVVAVLMVPSVSRWQIERQTRRLYLEGANTGVVGPHELELIEGELIERTPINELRSALRGIERVVNDGEYTFIYLSAVMAHVIPHTTVTEGDPRAFGELLKQRLSAEQA